MRGFRVQGSGFGVCGSAFGIRQIPGATRQGTALPGVRARVAAAVLIAATIGACGGCGTTRPSLATLPDVAADRRQRHDEAFRQFVESRDQAELEAARASWLEGDHRTAVKRLRQIVARSPDSVGAQLLLAELLLIDGRPEEAVDVLAPVAEAHPENVRVQQTMDLLLEELGEHVSPSLSRIEAERRPTALMPPAATVLPSQLLASSADGWLPDLHVPAPHDPMAVPARFEAPAEGAKAVGSAAAADDSDGNKRSDSADRAPWQALIADGCGALAAGDAEAARSHFQKAVALEPDNPQIPLSAAVAALRHDHPVLAIELLEPICDGTSGSASRWRVLGAAHYRQGDFQASQTALEQALSLDKGNALSYFLMGLTLSKLGEPEAAERHFRQAERLDPRYALRR